MQLRTATIADVWRYGVAANWSPPAHEYERLVAEAMAGRVWCGVAAGADPVALGGVLRTGADEPGTCWLMVAPGASRRILATTLLMRRVIRFEAPAFAAGLVCVVADGNERGQRLARALGFVRTEETVGALRNWRLAWAVSPTS